MADPAPQNLAAPALSSLGLYWTGTGWSAVMSNPYFQTNYMFYQSPLRGAAGPADQIARDLTSLGINYQVIDQAGRRRQPPAGLSRRDHAKRCSHTAQYGDHQQ